MAQWLARPSAMDCRHSCATADRLWGLCPVQADFSPFRTEKSSVAQAAAGGRGTAQRAPAPPAEPPSDPSAPAGNVDADADLAMALQMQEVGPAACGRIALPCTSHGEGQERLGEACSPPVGLMVPLGGSKGSVVLSE